MNPYEWPWENDPVESSEWTRVTTRLRKKVRKLSRRVSRMDRELRKIRKQLVHMASASAASPPASELTRRLVGEAQRAAAAYTATRSAAAFREASRARDALLEHVATLESGRPPLPAATRAAPPPSVPTAPRVQPPAAPAAAVAPEPPAPPTETPTPSPVATQQLSLAGPTSPSPEVPETIYRWIRDAVSLLRVAGFANEGHVILRSQLTDQALSFMARRPAGESATAPLLSQDADGERAPIGRPRLSTQRASAGPPSMANRSMPRSPEPAVAPVRPLSPMMNELTDDPWAQREGAGSDSSWGSAYSEVPAPDSRDVPVQREPGEGSAMDSPGLDFPLADAPDFAPYVATEEDQGGEGDENWAAQPPTGEGSDAPSRESQDRGDPGPRRWWSYAPAPPPPGE